MDTLKLLDEHLEKMLHNYIDFYRKRKIAHLKRDLLELQKIITFHPTMSNKIKYQALRQVIREKQKSL